MDNTLEFYKMNAESFAGQTLSVDFSAVQDRFLEKLPEGSHILDFGCGAGRDTKYFLSKGYSVTAIDGSPELCKIASAYTQHEVRQMLFQDLNDAEKYDGIWACASVLHLNHETLKDVFMKMVAALRQSGILYASFKYGNFEGERNGRWYTDFDENSFCSFIKDFPELSIEDMWTSSDVRSDRKDEKWLNIFLRKTVFR